MCKTVAELALTVTKINVNSICYGKSYQPKLPLNANKLKK